MSTAKVLTVTASDASRPSYDLEWEGKYTDGFSYCRGTGVSLVEGAGMFITVSRWRTSDPEVYHCPCKHDDFIYRSVDPKSAFESADDFIGSGNAELSRYVGLELDQGNEYEHGIKLPPIPEDATFVIDRSGSSEIAIWVIYDYAALKAELEEVQQRGEALGITLTWI